MKRTILLMLLFCFSCSNNDEVPTGIIQSEEMSAILWDIIRAQTLATEVARKDSLKNTADLSRELNLKIFDIHKVRQADFDESYDWYTRNPGVLKNLVDSLYTKKQRENDQIVRETFKPLEKDSASLKILEKNE